MPFPSGYPDLLDASGFNIIERTLKHSSNQTLLLTALKWSVECCIKHEQNREVRFFVFCCNVASTTTIVKFGAHGLHVSKLNIKSFLSHIA